jgi:ABC-type Mn2+/Zn2+ transport system permease subunit
MALGELFGEPWFWQAVAAVGAVSLACSLLSVLVVIKRMAFIGQGISHAGFGGYALAVFLGLAGGWTEQIIVVAFCLATAWAVGSLSRRRTLEVDTAIGVLLVAAMALGVLLLNLRIELQNLDWYRQRFGASATVPWEQQLFGQIVWISPLQLRLSVGLSLAVILLAATLFKELVFFTFDEPVSRVFGVPSRAMHYLTLTMLALTVVVGMQLVGFILVSALLVMPGAGALLLSRRLPVVLSGSAAIGVVGSLAGLLLAGWQGDLSPGACIVGVLFLAFLACAAISRLRGA